MARRKGDGKNEAALGLFHDMLEELRGVRAEARETNGRLGRLEDRLGRLEDEVHTGFADLRGGLREVTVRLENIRDLAGEQYRRLDERVTRVEAKLFGT